jgi:hypothetical protein
LTIEYHHSITDLGTEYDGEVVAVFFVKSQRAAGEVCAEKAGVHGSVGEGVRPGKLTPERLSHAIFLP